MQQQQEEENKGNASPVEQANQESKDQMTLADGPQEPQMNGENQQKATEEEKKKSDDTEEQNAESKKKNKKGAKTKNDKGERKNKKENEVKEEKLTLQDLGITDDEGYKPNLIKKVKELLQSKERAEQKKAV